MISANFSCDISFFFKRTIRILTDKYLSLSCKEYFEINLFILSKKALHFESLFDT